MPITIRFEKTDEHGNTYYEDASGNRIVEELTLTQDEQYYVDTTPEDWARDKIEEAALREFYKEQDRLKNTRLS
ncbi:MAG: hypothetical protein M0D57_13655 [Sphingobacteriales bacterium JAD_PAG50586_3]|nr:MAG: hypothetical protein M0D57_13655 [Sphingobacteriales bacterium JAD_PAG50586_3]